MPKRIGRRISRKIYLREWREFREMSQADLAYLIHATDVTVSRWESGHRYMDVGSLSAAARALHCEVENLFHPPGRKSIDAMLKHCPPELVDEFAHKVAVLLEKRKK